MNYIFCKTSLVIHSFPDYHLDSLKNKRHFYESLRRICLNHFNPNGQIPFKNLVAFTVIFLKYVWPFFDVMYQRINPYSTDVPFYFDAFQYSVVSINFWS